MPDAHFENAAARFQRRRRLSRSHGRFAWYELLTTDVAAARAFYREVVGWSAQDASTAAFPYSLFLADKVEVGGLMELPGMDEAGCGAALDRICRGR